jgi:hypothetical protein
MYCRYCEERPSGVALTKSANRKTRLKRTLKKNVSDIYIIRYLGMVDDATNSKDTNDLITLSPISITMVAVFFVSRGSSPIRRIILYPLLCLIHFQCCLSFLSRAQSCEQYTCTKTQTSRSTTVVSLSFLCRRDLPGNKDNLTQVSIESTIDVLGREAISV